MSSNVIIDVSHLGKKYRLRHDVGRAHRKTLRDVIAEKARRIFSKSQKSASGNPAPASGGGVVQEDFWALKDVSFEIKRGEVLGIIGRNGAGKSTLLKILSRITEPSEGRVHLKGRVASLLEVGTGFHAELTGRENIFLNGAILGMSRAEIRKKFDEIVAFAEVEKFLDTPVKRYSSGMYVRLAFAVAAHLEPEVLIVDEVLAVGDAQFQKKCLGKMQDVAAHDGRTVMFVSHNMGAVLQLTTRCIVLANGRVAFDGDSETAVEKYSSAGGYDQGTSFAVEFEPRKFMGNQNARILLLRFEKNAPQFSASEDFSFIVKIRANQPLPQLRVSFTLFSADGTPVGGVFSSDGQAMNLREEAEFRVRLPCPHLAPGHYYTGVGVGRGNPGSGHVDFDVVLETLPFEVLPGKGEDGVLSSWTTSWGRIIFPSVQVEKVS